MKQRGSLGVPLAIIIAGIFIAGAILISNTKKDMDKGGNGEALGIKTAEEFNECLDSGRYTDEVKNDTQDGRAAEVTGTPSAFIGLATESGEIEGYKIVGAQPPQVFLSLIDDLSQRREISVEAEGPFKVSVDDDPFLGDENAPVVLIEFSDFKCGYCARLASSIKEALNDYLDQGKLKLVFRDFAFLSPESVLAAEAAGCADEQGKFWEYHDLLFENQQSGEFNKDTLETYAAELGLK